MEHVVGPSREARCGMTDQKCSICNTPSKGGLYTNGDGYGDAKIVDFDPGPFLFYCWACSDQAPNHNEEITRLFIEKGMCGFLEAWVGRCTNTAPCVKHTTQTCWCGKQATRNCDVTGTLVCGAPLCAEHECKIGGERGRPHSERGWIEYCKFKAEDE